LALDEALLDGGGEIQLDEDGLLGNGGFLRHGGRGRHGHAAGRRGGQGVA
jgi:hypothetical protein